MAIYEYEGKQPQLAPGAWVADSAQVIGAVNLAANASVWFGAVIRGDAEPIDIGEGSNIQDGSVLHTDPGKPLTVGNFVTVGHQVMLHGCTIGDNCLIGIGAIILNGAKIGKNCLVGAGALITEGKEYQDISAYVEVASYKPFLPEGELKTMLPKLAASADNTSFVAVDLSAPQSSKSRRRATLNSRAKFLSVADSSKLHLQTSPSPSTDYVCVPASVLVAYCVCRCWNFGSKWIGDSFFDYKSRAWIAIQFFNVVQYAAPGVMRVLEVRLQRVLLIRRA